MANPMYQAITAVGTGTPLVLDHYMNPSIIEYAVELGAGAAATFGVQYTLDDVNDPTWPPVWYADTNIPAGTAVSTSANRQGPIRALRVVTSAFTAGPARFAVLQGLSQN